MAPLQVCAIPCASFMELSRVSDNLARINSEQGLKIRALNQRIEEFEDILSNSAAQAQQDKIQALEKALMAENDKRVRDEAVLRMNLRQSGETLKHSEEARGRLCETIKHCSEALRGAQTKLRDTRLELREAKEKLNKEPNVNLVMTLDGKSMATLDALNNNLERLKTMQGVEIITL